MHVCAACFYKSCFKPKWSISFNPTCKAGLHWALITFVTFHLKLTHCWHLQSKSGFVLLVGSMSILVCSSYSSVLFHPLQVWSCIFFYFPHAVMSRLSEKPATLGFSVCIYVSIHRGVTVQKWQWSCHWRWMWKVRLRCVPNPIPHEPIDQKGTAESICHRTYSRGV